MGLISAGVISLTVLKIRVGVRHTIVVVLSIIETGFNFDSSYHCSNNLDNFNCTNGYAAVHRRYDRSETVVSPRCCHI